MTKLLPGQPLIYERANGVTYARYRDPPHNKIKRWIVGGDPKAVAEAKRIDEESMAKHNRDATVISMILGFTTLALFVDGLLRMLGIIPPFMEIDINILDKIETDIIDRVKQVPIQKILQSGFR